MEKMRMSMRMSMLRKMLVGKINAVNTMLLESTNDDFKGYEYAYNNFLQLAKNTDNLADFIMLLREEVDEENNGSIWRELEDLTGLNNHNDFMYEYNVAYLKTINKVKLLLQI